MKLRKRLFEQRRQICLYSLILALFGMVLSVVEAELTASSSPLFAKSGVWSQSMRALILISTILLLILIVLYHSREIQIAAVETKADNWRVVVSWKLILQLGAELVICGICPIPGTGHIFWPCIQDDHRSVVMMKVPLDVVLSTGIFMRSYLLPRFLVIHSKKFHDPATRSIAALNRVAVDFRFVLKTLMVEHPLKVLAVFTFCFWICASWMSAQCDRYGMVAGDGVWGLDAYLDSLWLVAVTFLTVGYGNLFPRTYCGRMLATVTGIAGTGASAAFVAVVAMKLRLTRAEKCVNNFVSDCHLSGQQKNAAAAVMQHAWHVYKCNNSSLEEGMVTEKAQLHLHQKNLFRAINKFRDIKWDLRMLAEREKAVIQIGKGQIELQEKALEIRHSQEHMLARVSTLVKEVYCMDQYQHSLGNAMSETQKQLTHIMED